MKVNPLQNLECNPPIGLTEEASVYLKGLQDGEQVMECEQSNCMRNTLGTVHHSQDGVPCVHWHIGGGMKMGTSVTHGTRRISDIKFLDSLS